jgi:hypothetical protein
MIKAFGDGCDPKSDGRTTQVRGCAGAPHAVATIMAPEPTEIGGASVLFMVIETFGRDAKGVYRRFRDKGRMMPDGVSFVGSWVTADLQRCFQLMECDDVALLQRWVAEWSDIAGFEIVPVVAGKDTAAALAAQL